MVGLSRALMSSCPGVGRHLRCIERAARANGARVIEHRLQFKVYEDGSTAGRFQRNKGRFEEGFNVSIDSASMLQAYFKHVLTVGKEDLEAGSRTDDQMRQLFR